MTDTTTIFARLEKAEQNAARWRELSEAEALVAVLRQDYARATAAQAKADANSAKDAAAQAQSGAMAATTSSRGIGPC